MRLNAVNKRSDLFEQEITKWIRLNEMKYCALTFDIENWFQVENLRSAINKNNWDGFVSTVEVNTKKILDLLGKFDIKATFFILGSVAENHPGLVREISAQGHEIASHGYGHDLTYDLSDEQLRSDIFGSKKILEELSGKEVVGYRAPNFSVTDRLVELLMDLGFVYDSSLNPFKLHKRYGKLERSVESLFRGNLLRIDRNFYEIPASVVSLFSQQVPIGGGAYFRILPLSSFKAFAARKLHADNFYHMYMHPWEFEPQQPRIKEISLSHKFRHYTGLAKTEQKFESFILFLKSKKCSFLTLQEFVQRFANYNT